MSYTAKTPVTHIMASARNGTLYIGVTSNLLKRATQHRDSTIAGFTTKYRCTMLVFFELHADMPAAIAREKQLKAGFRFKKLALIESTNPLGATSATISFKRTHPPRYCEPY